MMRQYAGVKQNCAGRKMVSRPFGMQQMTLTFEGSLQPLSDGGIAGSWSSAQYVCCVCL